MAITIISSHYLFGRSWIQSSVLQLAFLIAVSFNFPSPSIICSSINLKWATVASLCVIYKLPFINFLTLYAYKEPRSKGVLKWATNQSSSLSSTVFFNEDVSVSEGILFLWCFWMTSAIDFWINLYPRCIAMNKDDSNICMIKVSLYMESPFFIQETDALRVYFFLLNDRF
jgi:hypothetical protein